MKFAHRSCNRAKSNKSLRKAQEYAGACVTEAKKASEEVSEIQVHGTSLFPFDSISESQRLTPKAEGNLIYAQNSRTGRLRNLKS